MSGNKGAVGIQLGYHETNFCLVTAHPASGPGNAEERNTEYCTVVNGLHFFRGKTVESLGLGLSTRVPPLNFTAAPLLANRHKLSHRSLVRAYDEDDALGMLLAADQLNFAITPGTAFSA
jgi:hypothetical protein